MRPRTCLQHSAYAKVGPALQVCKDPAHFCMYFPLHGDTVKWAGNFTAPTLNWRESIKQHGAASR